MIITWFHAGSSRSGNSVDLAFFYSDQTGQVFDACPMIERLAGIKIDDRGRGIFTIRTRQEDRNMLLILLSQELNCKIVRG